MDETSTQVETGKEDRDYAIEGEPAPRTEAVEDAFLLKKYVREGDRQALAALLQKYANLAYYTAVQIVKNSSDAEDVVQMSFINVFKKASQYKDTHGVKAWFMKIVVNNSRKVLRERGRRTKRYENYATSQEMNTMTSNSATMGQESEILQLVMNLISGLPERYRLPLMLHYREGLSFRELTEVLAAPEKTLRSQVSRGMDRLRSQMATAGVAMSGAGIMTAVGAVSLEPVPDSLLESITGLIEEGPAHFSSALIRAAGVEAKAGVLRRTVAGIVAAVALGAGGLWVNDILDDRQTAPPPVPVVQESPPVPEVWKEEWIPLATEPRLAFMKGKVLKFNPETQTNLSEIPALSKSEGDEVWRVESSPAGARVIRTRKDPGGGHCLIIGPAEPLPRQWKGVIVPQGGPLRKNDVVGFLLGVEGKEMGTLGLHRPEGKEAYPFRIVAWRDEQDRIQVASMRQIGRTKKMGFGTIMFSREGSKTNFVRVGFAATPQVVFEKISSMALPPGWTIEQTPGLHSHLKRYRASSGRMWPAQKDAVVQIPSEHLELHPPAQALPPPK